jgi:hypothetical protein
MGATVAASVPRPTRRPATCQQRTDPAVVVEPTRNATIAPGTTSTACPLGGAATEPKIRVATSRFQLTIHVIRLHAESPGRKAWWSADSSPPRSRCRAPDLCQKHYHRHNKER